MLVLVAGCADTEAPGGGMPDRTSPGWGANDTLVADGYAGELTANATVLADDTHGPQLCS